jgi:hypothetical protein
MAGKYAGSPLTKQRPLPFGSAAPRRIDSHDMRRVIDVFNTLIGTYLASTVSAQALQAALASWATTHDKITNAGSNNGPT